MTSARYDYLTSAIRFFFFFGIDFWIYVGYNHLFEINYENYSTVLFFVANLGKSRSPSPSLLNSTVKLRPAHADLGANSSRNAKIIIILPSSTPSRLYPCGLYTLPRLVLPIRTTY